MATPRRANHIPHRVPLFLLPAIRSSQQTTDLHISHSTRGQFFCNRGGLVTNCVAQEDGVAAESLRHHCRHRFLFISEFVMSPGAVTQVVQGLSALAGAWVIKSILDAEQEKPMDGFSQCPTCNGSRRVPCMCTRWSDDDVGCNTCEGSGMMRCNSCGGSGTGKPIPVQIRASNPPRNA